MEKLILASASPRRAKLLQQIRIDFEQIVSGIEDERTETTDPGEHVLLLSKRKAKNVIRETSERWILGADTIVVLDGCIMGKPCEGASAFHMLRRLNGRDHTVFTGLTLFDTHRERELSQYEATRVWIRHLSDGEIEDYVASSEPLGKAGGYAIQGLGATLVEKIEGCYYNVVGLPLVRLLTMMRDMDFPFRLRINSGEREIP